MAQVVHFCLFCALVCAEHLVPPFTCNEKPLTDPNWPKGSEKKTDQKIEMATKCLGQEVPVYVGKQKYMLLSLGTFVGISHG